MTRAAKCRSRGARAARPERPLRVRRRFEARSEPRPGRREAALLPAGADRDADRTCRTVLLPAERLATRGPRFAGSSVPGESRHRSAAWRRRRVPVADPRVHPTTRIHAAQWRFEPLYPALSVTRAAKCRSRGSRAARRERPLRVRRRFEAPAGAATGAPGSGPPCRLTPTGPAEPSCSPRNDSPPADPVSPEAASPENLDTAQRHGAGADFPSPTPEFTARPESTLRSGDLNLFTLLYPGLARRSVEVGGEGRSARAPAARPVAVRSPAGAATGAPGSGLLTGRRRPDLPNRPAPRGAPRHPRASFRRKQRPRRISTPLSGTAPAPTSRRRPRVHPTTRIHTAQWRFEPLYPALSMTRAAKCRSRGSRAARRERPLRVRRRFETRPEPRPERREAVFLAGRRRPRRRPDLPNRPAPRGTPRHPRTPFRRKQRFRRISPRSRSRTHGAEPSKSATKKGNTAAPPGPAAAVADAGGYGDDSLSAA